MGDILAGGLIGFVVALVVMALVWFLGTKRAREKHQSEIARLDESIRELRHERAEDKETNRRLRHEMASRTPDRLIESAVHAEQERDAAINERDHAIEQLELVRGDLGQANRRLADRENKLRDYRQALKEIRLSLEAQESDPTGSATSAATGLIDSDTGDLPIDPLTGAALSAAGLIEGAGGEYHIEQVVDLTDSQPVEAPRADIVD